MALLEAHFSFWVQATFLYEQQVHCAHDTVFRCLHTWQMHDGMSFWFSRLSCAG